MEINISIGILLLILNFGCQENSSSNTGEVRNQKMQQAINLKKPDNRLEFFQDLKIKSEEYWKTVELNTEIYGFQIQKDTKWNKGLTEEQIDSFEKEIGVKFSKGLRNYYRVMNGVNLPAINIYGNSGEEPTYSNNFYSYPNDLNAIKDRINWIYEANKVTEEELTEKGISRIFPIFAHRFVLLDSKDEFVLSMYGDDIIYWADNISKSLTIEIFEGREFPIEFKENQNNVQKIKFWLGYE